MCLYLPVVVNQSDFRNNSETEMVLGLMLSTEGVWAGSHVSRTNVW